MGFGKQAREAKVSRNKTFGILNVVIAMLTVIFVFIYIFPGIKNPDILLKYPRVTYIIVSFAAFAIWTGFCILFSVISRKVIYSQGAGAFAAVIVFHGVALAMAFVMILLSALLFPKNLGTVTISTADELEYLKNYPQGSYVLGCDIDFKCNEWESVKEFSGELDGNGHSVSNITIGEKGFICNNKGTVKDFNLKNVSYTKFDVYCDYGTLVSVNNGKIISCKLQNNAGTTPDPSDVPCAAFIVGVNNGVITDCAEKPYEAVAQRINHRFTDAAYGYKEPTCTSEGSHTVRCSVCGYTETETLPLTEHTYVKIGQTDANCTHNGHVDYICPTCGQKFKSTIPVNGVHRYKTVGYTGSRNNNVCEICGDQYYSYRTKTFNGVFFVSAAVALIFLIVLIAQIIEEDGLHDLIRYRPGKFWPFAVILVISLGVFGSHLFIASHQTDGEKFYDRWLTDPPDSECVFYQTSRRAPTFEQQGEVVYTCSKCGKQYVEYIPVRTTDEDEFDWSSVEVYVGKDYTAIEEFYESEVNNSKEYSNALPFNSRVTARLLSDKDVDIFAYTVTGKSDVTFDFSHEGDNIYAYWSAKIISSENEAVLAEGYIPSMKKGAVKTIKLAELDAGTYYFIVTKATGANPLTVSYSDAEYHITAKCACVSHKEALFVRTVPTCSNSGEIVYACTVCGAVTETKTVDPLGHSFGEWSLTKEPMLFKAGEKERTCIVCSETESRAVWAQILILPYLIATAVVFIIAFFNTVFEYDSGGKAAFVLILLLITAVAGILIALNEEAFLSATVKYIFIGGTMFLHCAMIAAVLSAFSEDRLPAVIAWSSVMNVIACTAVYFLFPSYFLVPVLIITIAGAVFQIAMSIWSAADGYRIWILWLIIGLAVSTAISLFAVRRGNQSGKANITNYETASSESTSPGLPEFEETFDTSEEQTSNDLNG